VPGVRVDVTGSTSLGIGARELLPYDVRGRALKGHVAHVSYAWNVASDGSVRLSHHTLLHLVGQALDELAATAGPLAGEVVAAGISCFFHSIVGLDADGRPITPVLSWADTTSSDVAAILRPPLPSAVQDRLRALFARVDTVSGQ